MSVKPEPRTTQIEVAVYRCDRCNAKLGENDLGNGYSLIVTLYPDPDGKGPRTPPYDKDWHWELCADCLGWIVNQIGKGESPNDRVV